MKKKTTKKIKVSKFEKTMMFLIVLVGILIPVTVVASKSILSRSNIELESVKSKVEKQQNINESLEMQVNELAGLSYNNDNIIVIK